MRRLAAALSGALLVASLIAVGRPDPHPQQSEPCDLGKGAGVVASRGLAFIGPPWLSEYLLVSRKPDSVVEISAPVRIGYERSLASRLYPVVDHVPDATFGGAYLVNVEDLLDRRPAVVVQSIFADRLLRFGLCAVPLGLTNFGTDAGIAEHAHIYAMLAGLPQRAARLVDRYQSAQSGLARDLSRLPKVPTPRVLMMGMSRYGAVFAQGGLHPMSTFIARAGGVNALLDRKSLGVRLDAERLLALDPDDIFLGQALAGETPSPEMLRHSRLGRLRAIAGGHVFALPPEWTIGDSVVTTPAYERWMAERLHPNLPGNSARSALRHAYEEDLGVVLPEAWLDDALADARR